MSGYPPTRANFRRALAIARGQNAKAFELRVATSLARRRQRLLTNTIDDDRYPLSPRIQTLKAILSKIRPDPARDPLPPPKQYEPPRLIRGRRRR